MYFVTVSLDRVCRRNLVSVGGTFTLNLSDSSLSVCAASELTSLVSFQTRGGGARTRVTNGGYPNRRSGYLDLPGRGPPGGGGYTYPATASPTDSGSYFGRRLLRRTPTAGVAQRYLYSDPPRPPPTRASGAWGLAARLGRGLARGFGGGVAEAAGLDGFTSLDAGGLARNVGSGLGRWAGDEMFSDA